MLRIKKETSLTLSTILSVGFFFLIGVAACIIPGMLRAMARVHLLTGLERALSAQELSISIGLAYAILLIGVIANCMLLWLLMRVRQSLVFTDTSVQLIRGVSWCAIFAGLLFAALGYFFHVSILLAFCALFLGFCLRVVKNVIEEAVSIKAENDLTV